MNRGLQEKRLQLAEDLVNSYDTFLAEPEHLPIPEDLHSFLLERGIRPEQPIGQSELEEIYRLRSKLRAVYEAVAEEHAAQILNELFAHSQVTPRLAAGPDHKYSLELMLPTDISIQRRVEIEAALGLSFGLSHYGKERLRICAAAPCRDAFLDTSRNRSRRFCSERCANRYNVAAFRARHVEE
ncbi:zf-CGNR multi-domain protein [Ktedonosporobacter rubrisoli]|uniref:Zf-CGNR multi-domain protein n=1 Tax=Ktedonosporobacter rubrisoli TaxID=2509675 RepID=A0A4P6JTD5_KTERU|nr:CGNR zinc finger domain-containing protein [Ktedonosporobacter rubrisoli]QBD78828.1 zf-CGNR multi-domain protein [Ktedonosporobacter rubrisoli]